MLWPDVRQQSVAALRFVSAQCALKLFVHSALVAHMTVSRFYRTVATATAAARKRRSTSRRSIVVEVVVQGLRLCTSAAAINIGNFQQGWRRQHVQMGMPIAFWMPVWGTQLKWHRVQRHVTKMNRTRKNALFIWMLWWIWNIKRIKQFSKEWFGR